MTLSADRRAQLELQTSEAAAGQRRLDANLSALEQEPLRPGDLFVVPAHHEHPVQWLLVAIRPGDDRVLIAPADTFPAIGSRDLELVETESAAPLALRCGHQIWVPRSALEGAQRTGAIDQPSVESALQTCREVEQGARAASDQALAVDQETEYLDWEQEVLLEARAAWDTRRGPAAGSAPSEVAATSKGRASFLRLAAAVLLGIGAGLASAYLWLGSGKDEADQRLQLENRVASLEQQLQDDERTHQQDQERLAELQARHDETRRELTALQQHAEAAADSIVANPPLTFLESDILRDGSTKRVEVPGSAQHVTVVLLLDPEPTGHSFELQVSARDGHSVWQGEVARGTDELFVAVRLPSKLLPPGTTTFRLTELESNSPWIGEYRLEVVRR